MDGLLSVSEIREHSHSTQHVLACYADYRRSLTRASLVNCQIAIKHFTILIDTLRPSVQEVFTLGTQLIDTARGAVRTGVPTGNNEAIAFHLAQGAVDRSRIRRTDAQSSLRQPVH